MARPFAPVQPALAVGVVQDGLLYREHAPPPALAAAVACFWTIETPAPLARPYVYRIVPDACVDLVFDVGDGAGAWVFGPLDRPFTAPLERRTALFGIRTYPGCFGALVGPPSGSLAGQVHDLAAVLGRDATAWHAALHDAPDTRTRIALAAAELATLRERRGRPDRRAAALVATVVDAPHVPVTTVARRLGITPRHLGRLCRTATGFGPKRLARIVRMQSALRALRERPGASPADVAAALGFVDQAHLGAELRTLAATTPGQVRRAVARSDFS